MSIEAMKAALEWMERVSLFTPDEYDQEGIAAAEALSTAIEQAEKQEPVAWYFAGSAVEPPSVALTDDLDAAQKNNCTPLYVAPSQREWQGLTMEEADVLVKEFGGWSVDTVGHVMVFAVEDTLKEKNT